MLALAGTNKESLEMQMETPSLFFSSIIPPASIPLLISCSSRDTVKLYANSFPLLSLLSELTGMI